MTHETLTEDHRKSRLMGGEEKSKIAANQPTGGDLRPIFAGFEELHGRGEGMMVVSLEAGV